MKSTEQQTEDNSRRKFLKSAAILSAFTIVPRHVLGGVGYLAPSDQITLGFIGTGRQGFTLKNAFIKENSAKIIASCDVYKNKADLFSKQTNEFYVKNNSGAGQDICKTHYDFRDVLQRKDIDAVVLALPDHWHAAVAVRAAAAGKDIYCEKPLSLSIAEGRAMVQAAKKHKRVFQTGSMQRSWKEFRQTANIMRNEMLGPIQTIKVSIGGPPKPYTMPKETIPTDLDWNFWLGPNEPMHYNHLLNPPLEGSQPWAQWRYTKGLGGGDVTDWGAHMFDIVQWGLDMDRSGPVALNPPGKDQEHLSFRYANGITVTHENFGKNNAIQIVGAKGKLEVQRGKLETSIASLADYQFTDRDQQVYHSDNHYLDFLNAVKNRGNTIANAETGHRTATVGNLVNICYELNQPLLWNPEEESFDGNQEANLLRSRPMKKEWKV